MKDSADLGGSERPSSLLDPSPSRIAVDRESRTPGTSTARVAAELSVSAGPQNLLRPAFKAAPDSLATPTPDGKGGWLEDEVLEKTSGAIDKVLKRTKNKICSVRRPNETSAIEMLGPSAVESETGLVEQMPENVTAQGAVLVNKMVKPAKVRPKNLMDAVSDESMAESTEILVQQPPDSSILREELEGTGAVEGGAWLFCNGVIDAQPLQPSRPLRMDPIELKVPDGPITDRPRSKQEKKHGESDTAVLVEITSTKLIFEQPVLSEDFQSEDPKPVDGKEKKKKKKRQHKKHCRKAERHDDAPVLPVIEITDMENPGAEKFPEKRRIPRSSLHISPSDATAFEKPEPVVEFGPIRKPIVALVKRAPQTALMMSLANQRKYEQSRRLVPQPVISTAVDSELSYHAVEVAVVKLNSAVSMASKVIQVIQQDEKSSSFRSGQKKKRIKKVRKRAMGELKMETEAPSLVTPKVFPSTSNKSFLPIFQEPIENEVIKEEIGEENRKRKKGNKKKKKKRRKSGTVGSLNKDSNTANPDEPSKLEATPVKVDELWGKAVGNFFVLEDVLGKGGFGEARRGRHITTGKKYAIKLERVADAESLADEYKLYQIIGQRIGFPRCYYFGVGPKDNNALVMDLLGPSLEEYFRAMERKWSLKTACMVALQVLERIEYVHSKGYVYSDIKPENFLVGLAEKKQEGIIFLIDFGLAQHFKDKETGKYCYDENLKTHPVGTMRYMSVRSHEARSLSYRDDLESIGYLIIYFLRGRLPWQGMAMKDRQKKVKAVGLQKKNISVEELCQDCPPEVQDYMKYVRSIQFYAEPKYERLRTFFSNVLLQNKWADDGAFDWVGKVYDFKQNKKSESVLGGKLVATSGKVAAEEKLLSKRQLGETKRERTETPPRKPVIKPETPKPVKKPVLPPLPSAPPGLATPKSGQPDKNLRNSTPKGAMDPTIDPIIAFSAREAERPSRETPSSWNGPRPGKTGRIKDEDPCNCC